jgi:hypothetical protein
MSYPEPRYVADSGVVSATFRPDGQPPEIRNAGGTTTHSPI